MSDNNSNSFLWFLAGLGIGAVAVELCMRRVLAMRLVRCCVPARKMGEFVRDWRVRRASKPRPGPIVAAKVLNQQKEQFRSAYEAGRQAYQEATTAEGGGPQNP